MNQMLSQIRNKAAKLQKTLVLPESWDVRTIQAATEILEKKLARVILINTPDLVINESIREAISEGRAEICSPDSDPEIEIFAKTLFEKRKSKGMSLEQARAFVTQPVAYGAALVAHGRADGCVAGAVTTTADVMRAAIYLIGLKENTPVVSSCFLMAMPDGRVFTYGDCAVVPVPTAEQLAAIAIDSSETHYKLTGVHSKTALLSFSTKGSASHPGVSVVQEAVQLARNHRPDLIIDGELQFDAAISSAVGSRKAPDSPVAGQANVFIFPTLDAGNIGYKITERLAGAQATGPIIQGLAKPMNDLSRGCSAADIVNTVCVCAVLA